MRSGFSNIITNLKLTTATSISRLFWYRNCSMNQQTTLSNPLPHTIWWLYIFIRPLHSREWWDTSNSGHRCVMSIGNCSCCLSRIWIWMLRESDWKLVKENVWEMTGDRSGMNYVITDVIIEEMAFCQEFWAASWLCSDGHTGSYDGFNHIDIGGNGLHHCLWASVCLNVYVVVVILSVNVCLVDGVCACHVVVLQKGLCA